MARILDEKGIEFTIGKQVYKLAMRDGKKKQHPWLFKKVKGEWEVVQRLSESHARKFYSNYVDKING